MKTGPLFTVNAISKTPVTALSVCRRIVVQEDPSVTGWPTSAYFVYAPTNADSAKQRDAGQEQFFEKPHGQFFVVGEIAGYIELVVGGGSTSFNQFED
jgi:hypothetical protein